MATQKVGATRLGGDLAGFSPVQGRIERHEITLLNDRYFFGSTRFMRQFSLFTKEQGSGKYNHAPFIPPAIITDVTNTTNFVCDIPNAYREFFATGDTVCVLDVSAGTGVNTFVDDTADDATPDSMVGITIDAISAVDGGTGGTGFTKITCTGETLGSSWSAAAGDVLVLAKYAMSDRLVLVEEPILFTADSVAITVAGIFVADRIDQNYIWNTTYVDKTKLYGRNFLLEDVYKG